MRKWGEEIDEEEYEDRDLDEDKDGLMTQSQSLLTEKGRKLCLR